MEHSKKSTEQTNIFMSVATYYNPATKKWEKGTFTLTKYHFQFIADSNNNDQFHLCIPLSTISGIEKRQSSLIYSAVVVSIGTEKHWFASFSNRDAVYNLLELFWREALLSKPYKSVSTSKPNISNSALGNDLLNLLHESESTLVEAANALSDQSRQLQDSEDAVEDINNDLNTAEKNMSFPRTLTLINSSFKKVNGNEQDKESRAKHYKVTFSFKRTSSDDGNWEKGTLVIADSVSVIDEQGSKRLQVARKELESLQVMSPWELCIAHSAKGIRKSCFLMCPQLSRLLKFLATIPVLKEKVVYADDDSSFYETASCSSSSSFGSALSSPSCPVPNVSSSKYANSKTEQIQDCNMLSEDDMLEISNVLNSLQAIAAEVSREQETQLERINTLISDMDKTELRIKADKTKMRKHT